MFFMHTFGIVITFKWNNMWLDTAHTKIHKYPCISNEFTPSTIYILHEKKQRKFYNRINIESGRSQYSAINHTLLTSYTIRKCTLRTQICVYSFKLNNNLKCLFLNIQYIYINYWWEKTHCWLKDYKNIQLQFRKVFFRCSDFKTKTLQYIIVQCH